MPSAEDMIRRANAVQKKASQDWRPRDIAGNILYEKDIVVVGYNNLGPIFGQVTKIKEGGLETPEGPLPTITEVICRLTPMSGPNGRLTQIVKIVNPESQQLLENMAGLPIRG